MAITISGQNNNDKILASDGVLDSISGFNVVGVMTASTFDVTGNSEVSGKLTANHLNIGSNINFGNAGIITATTLIGNVTGNVNHTSNLLLQISGNEKFRVGNSGQLGIGGANYGTSGQVLTSAGSGAPPIWNTISTDVVSDNSPQLGGDLQSNGSDIKFADNDKALFGADSDFRINHTGSHTELDSYTGNLSIRNLGTTGDIFIDAKSGERGIKIIQDGAVELYHDNTKRYVSYADGVKISTDSSIGRLVLADTDGNFCWQLTGYDAASAGSGGRGVFQDASGGLVLDMRASGGDIFCYNTLKLNGNASADNLKLVFGAGSDFEIFHDGTTNRFQSNGLKNFQFNPKDTDVGLKIIGDGACELYHDGTKKFETLSDGVNITGTLKVNGSAFSSSSDKIEEGNSFAEVLDTGTNGIFRFLAENNEVFRITTDGKIGLGQTANSFPTSRFEIRENAVGFTTSLLITNLNPSNQNNLNIVFASANNVPTASIGGWAHSDATSTANEKGDLFFRTKNAGAFKEHMRINHQGKMIYSCNHDQSSYFNDNYSGNHSRNVFNSVTHHKRYVGYNNPTWYEYKTTSGGSARPQLVYFTVYWSTGHASGFAYYNFHVLGRNPHNTSTLTIERARRGDYGSWGGQYYSWSSGPDITVYTSTKSGSDAGFFIRSQGHISANSGTWDGQTVQQWKIEAYDNQYAGIDNAIFTFAGHSTPSGVGGSVGWS